MTVYPLPLSQPVEGFRPSPTERQNVRERALASYLAFACGDALGATVEFLTKREIEYQYGRLDNIIGGGWLKLKAGDVTDDTQMALCIGRALQDAQHWDLARIAENFATWLRSSPPDVGNTCRRGIQRYIMHGTVSEPACESHAGNGAAMRNLPVVLFSLGDPQRLKTCSLEQAHITHNNSLSDDACFLLGLMTQHLILGGSIADAKAMVDAAIAQGRKSFRYAPYRGQSSAYILDTVRTVLHYFFTTETLEDCIIETACQGEDADTTAALAGMLAGAAYGLEALPKRWLKKLNQTVQTDIRQQVDDLLALSPWAQGASDSDGGLTAYRQAPLPARAKEIKKAV